MSRAGVVRKSTNPELGDRRLGYQHLAYGAVRVLNSRRTLATSSLVESQPVKSAAWTILHAGVLEAEQLCVGPIPGFISVRVRLGQRVPAYVCGSRSGFITTTTLCPFVPSTLLHRQDPFVRGK